MDEMRNDVHLDGWYFWIIVLCNEQIEKYNNDPVKSKRYLPPIPVPQESYMMDNNFTILMWILVSPEISNIEQPLRSANVPTSSIENLNIKIWI